MLIYMDYCVKGDNWRMGQKRTSCWTSMPLFPVHFYNEMEYGKVEHLN